MSHVTDYLLQLVRKQVVACYGEDWFLRDWLWPNPDAGYLRLKLPSGFDPDGWRRRQVDLRIRPVAEVISEAAVPDYLRPEVVHVGWLILRRLGTGRPDRFLGSGAERPNQADRYLRRAAYPSPA